MDLAALAIFRAVVRENGVTRAAAKLNRVQSNVTTRIKQLEEQLGAPLFVRDGRRLVLTPAGETLLPYAERLLALADEARHAVTENRPHGRLRLGAMESTAASRLPALLARYHQAWPDVTLELVTGTTGKLIGLVRDFELDAALVATPAGSEALGEPFETASAFTEELVLLTPRGHPRVRTPRDVRLPTLVAFERGCAYRGCGRALVRGGGAEARARARTRLVSRDRRVRRGGRGRRGRAALGARRPARAGQPRRAPDRRHAADRYDARLAPGAFLGGARRAARRVARRRRRGERHRRRGARSGEGRAPAHAARRRARNAAGLIRAGANASGASRSRSRSRSGHGRGRRDVT